MCLFRGDADGITGSGLMETSAMSGAVAGKVNQRTPTLLRCRTADGGLVESPMSVTGTGVEVESSWSGVSA